MQTKHSIDWNNTTCLAYEQIILNVCFLKIGTAMRKKIPSTFAANYQPLIQDLLWTKEKLDERITPRK